MVLLGLGDMVGDINILHSISMHLLLNVLKESANLGFVLIFLAFVASNVFSCLSQLENFEFFSNSPLLQEFLVLLLGVPSWDLEFTSPPWSIAALEKRLEFVNIGVLDHILVQNSLSEIPNVLLIMTMINLNIVWIRWVRVKIFSLQIVVDILLISVLEWDDSGGSDS